MSDSVLFRRLAKSYMAFILTLMYVPMLIVALASISKSRFFVFPVRRYDMKWYENTFSSLQIQDGCQRFLVMPVIVIHSLGPQ